MLAFGAGDLVDLGGHQLGHDLQPDRGWLHLHADHSPLTTNTGQVTHTLTLLHRTRQHPSVRYWGGEVVAGALRVEAIRQVAPHAAAATNPAWAQVWLLADQ